MAEAANASESGVLLAKVPWPPEQLQGSPVLNALIGATRSSMATLLTRLEDEYGSITAYLDWIGFDASWRARCVVH
jgi:hypothetical protein